MTKRATCKTGNKSRHQPECVSVANLSPLSNRQPGVPAAVGCARLAPVAQTWSRGWP